MAWMTLVAAGLLEIVWAVGLKYTEGFTRLAPTVATGLAMIVSLWLLGLSVRTIPIGTAYAVWTGIGASGTAVIGMAVLGEAATLARVVCILLILSGIIGLKLVSGV